MVKTAINGGGEGGDGRFVRSDSTSDSFARGASHPGTQTTVMRPFWLQRLSQIIMKSVWACLAEHIICREASVWLEFVGRKYVMRSTLHVSILT